MKKPVEHGNIFTSAILGSSSVVLAIVLKRDFYSILFWIPIWMGLFLYDVPFKKLWKSGENVLWMILIIISAIVSIYINLLLIIPYVIFFVDYAVRAHLAARRLGYAGTIIGILAYVILFVTTSGLIGLHAIILIGSLFSFMIGSEFTVRAKLSKRWFLLIYDLFPVFLSILSPVFLVFALSVVRIPVAFRAKGLKPVGITETAILLIVVIVLSLFYIA